MSSENNSVMACAPLDCSMFSCKHTHTHTQYHEGMGSELLKIMKSTEVQNPRRKCSAVVEMNCLVAEYRIPYRIVPRTIITHALLIDGLGHAT